MLRLSKARRIIGNFNYDNNYIKGGGNAKKE
jgi:hypothetical protein